ncbi:MAG: DUF4838 domain-containing protein [Bacteroidales bacterium]|jgi:hypothetical protein|nr:DUF4838 domain-containing protein [Bacteroidales bacterium]
MKRQLLIGLYLLVAFTAIAQSNNELVLVCNGKSNYEIKSESEFSVEAVKILSDYTDSITGIAIPISNKKKEKNPLIIFKSATGSESEKIFFDGFRIQTQYPNLIITATNSDGFVNAVFYILEHSFGCRYYAQGARIIPKNSCLTIRPIETIQNPAFGFRINYNGGAFNPDFAQWHALHNIPQKPNATSFEISDDWGMWVHTMHRLLPPEKWFSAHPEYFALRNDVRIPDQLCLSNPDVLKICIEELRKQMKLKPEAKYWSVSQMDNFNYCECADCKAIDEINGSPSGSMITFVNAIAKEFPEKIISTLAYQYTRKAPLKVKPVPNVNIMLCSIECNRNKPIGEDLSVGSFRHDLQEWGSLTDNIIVWDYVINFSNIIGPFPNFHVLQPNLQLFRDNHVQMIFEQGWPHPSGEFTELRCYLLTKLMWNPSLDTDSLMQDFCTGYYGSGGKYVYDYIKHATENLIKSGKALTLYEPMSAHASGFLSPENIEKYFKLFNSALMVTENQEPYNLRIQMAMQPIRYAWLEVSKSLPFTENWTFEQNDQGNYKAKDRAREILDDLYSLSKENGPILYHETSITPKDYYDRMTNYFANGVKIHKAVEKKIQFETPCSPSYSANGPTSLIDAVCGTENYFCLWQGWYGDDIKATIDLGKLEKISKVSLNGLVNHMSWIFPPDEIIILGSHDGIKYTQLGHLKNEEAREKIPAGIYPFHVQLNEPAECRFLKIIVQNIGKMPEWRGINENAWLFVDEIIVE